METLQIKIYPRFSICTIKTYKSIFFVSGLPNFEYRVTISQVNLKCYKNQILEEFCLTYFSFFLTVYCWSTYYTQLIIRNYFSCAINEQRIPVVLGLECSSRHILDMFLLFQRPSAARCCRKTLAMVCAAAIATVLLKNILRPSSISLKNKGFLT